MPNPPTPFLVAKLKGFPGKRAKRPPPEPPQWLSGYAREEWQRVAGELYQIGLLTCVELTALAIYCDTYSLWRTAREQLHAEGLTAETQEGRQCRHALTKTVREAAVDMIRFSAEFGLTPVARTRIANGLNPPAAEQVRRPDRRP